MAACIITDWQKSQTTFYQNVTVELLKLRMDYFEVHLVFDFTVSDNVFDLF